MIKNRQKNRLIEEGGFMKDNFSFRSSFNGFNREDVVSYISGLMERISDGERETEQLAQKAAELEKALEEMQNNSDAWEQEREKWHTRCISLEKDCDTWKERCEALEGQRVGLEQERSDAHSDWEQERVEMRARIESLERQLNECDRHTKNNEVKLGAAMLEAKRFSEMLVKEANDRAGAVYQNASICVTDSTSNAEKLRDQMKALSFEFTKTMGSVMSDMNGLIEAMSSFNNDLRDNGAKFLYESEFTGEEN